MNSEYILRINSKNNDSQSITSILGIKATSENNGWEVSIVEKSNLYSKAIDYFLVLIEKNIEKLNQIGILKEDLSIWYLYEYDQQCNMEFQPNELKRMGDQGITLCISCWKG